MARRESEPKSEALADVEISDAEPGDEVEEGLMLVVEEFEVDGQVLHIGEVQEWKYQYVFGGRLRRVSLGAYPEVSRTEAEAMAQRARDQVAAGIDPLTVN